MDRFLALSVFTKVVEAGSFTGAAKAMGLSPATVTGHVQALETHLKTRLLNRTTRRLALTDEGTSYYEHACHILSRMDEADTMLSSRRSSPNGVLRVTMPTLLGTLHLLPALPAFLDHYPELRVEATLSPQAPAFVEQNLDLGLIISLAPEPGLVFRPIGLARVHTLASPEYLARYGTPQSPHELDQHKLIGVRSAPGSLLSLWRFERAGRLLSLDLKARLVADGGDTHRVTALAHGGIIQGYHYAVADLIESGKLVPILQDWEWSGPPLGAMHLPNRFMLPKVDVFLDFVRHQLAGKIAPYHSGWVSS